VKIKKIKEWALSKRMDHCVRHSHDLRRWWSRVPAPASSSSFPPEFCWVFSHAILRDWICRDRIVDPAVLLLLLSPFKWLLLPRDSWLTPLEWKEWHRRDPFLWRRALRKKFPFLFCRKETKQASKEARVDQFLRFFSPTVCFFYSRTFCLASLWRSCFSVRQWLKCLQECGLGRQDVQVWRKIELLVHCAYRSAGRDDQ